MYFSLTDTKRERHTKMYMKLDRKDSSKTGSCKTLFLSISMVRASITRGHNQLSYASLWSSTILGKNIATLYNVDFLYKKCWVPIYKPRIKPLSGGRFKITKKLAFGVKWSLF